MSEWRKEAVEEYYRWRSELIDRYERLSNARAEYDQQISKIVAEVDALDRAAQVFNLDKTIEAMSSQVRTLFDDSEESEQMGFKDAALRFMEEIYPRGAKAIHVREYVEELLERTFHEKTAGMTLYRLSQENCVRREGHIWFWVPPNERLSLSRREVQNST